MMARLMVAARKLFSPIPSSADIQVARLSTSAVSCPPPSSYARTVSTAGVYSSVAGE